MGRPKLYGDRSNGGAPVLGVRLEPSLYDWTKAQGGVEYVRALLEGARKRNEEAEAHIAERKAKEKARKPKTKVLPQFDPGLQYGDRNEDLTSCNQCGAVIFFCGRNNPEQWGDWRCLCDGDHCGWRCEDGRFVSEHKYKAVTPEEAEATQDRRAALRPSATWSPAPCLPFPQESPGDPVCGGCCSVLQVQPRSKKRRCNCPNVTWHLEEDRWVDNAGVIAGVREPIAIKVRQRPRPRRRKKGL